MDIPSIIVALIAGGGGGAIIISIMTFLNERKKLKREYLESQLRNLYGPLYYLVLLNEKMIDLNDRHHLATRKVHFSGDKKWGRDDKTMEHLASLSEHSIEIANSYMDEVKKNNGEMKKILDQNYSYADLEDVKFFVKFLQDYYRLEKEFPDKLKTDLEVYQELEKEIGAISWMDKPFATRIKEKAEQKQSELRRISYLDPKSLL